MDGRKGRVSHWCAGKVAGSGRMGGFWCEMREYRNSILSRFREGPLNLARHQARVARDSLVRASGVRRMEDGGRALEMKLGTFSQPSLSSSSSSATGPSHQPGCRSMQGKLLQPRHVHHVRYVHVLRIYHTSFCYRALHSSEVMHKAPEEGLRASFCTDPSTNGVCRSTVPPETRTRKHPRGYIGPAITTAEEMAT